MRTVLLSVLALAVIATIPVVVYRLTLEKPDAYAPVTAPTVSDATSGPRGLRVRQGTVAGAVVAAHASAALLESVDGLTSTASSITTTEASTSKTEATTSKTEVPTSKTEATTRKTEAPTSKTEATTSKTEATTSKTQVSTSKTEATTSKANATTSKTEAPSSKTAQNSVFRRRLIAAARRAADPAA